MNHEKIKIALIDDHALFRKGVANLLSYNEQFEVVLEAANGTEYIGALHNQQIDVAILDINMPRMNGFELAEWIIAHQKNTSILVLSMIEKEEAVIKMIRNKIHGFLSKDIEAEELYKAVSTVAGKGYYYTDFISGILIEALDKKAEKKQIEALEINDRELQFLQLACSEHTYKEIATQMHLSAKTIDGYRNSLFEKLQVRSRVGLVLYAIKNQLVSL